MAENINPTQPVVPALPIKPSHNKQQDKNKNESPKKDTHDDDKQGPAERPHHGLFDEYV